MIVDAGWLLGIMLHAVPAETAEDQARYVSIARDVAQVASEEKPLYLGIFAEERTALVLLAIARHESDFRADVDTGLVRGDHGRSCTLWQLNRGVVACEPLLGDRKAAAREALRAVRQSFGACHGTLNAYVSGSCDRGQTIAARYLWTAQTWFVRYRP